jgi:hypothetical protein
MTTTSKLLAARAVISELRAENERLRAAHVEILGLWRRGETVQIGPIARAALEHKP